MNNRPQGAGTQAQRKTFRRPIATATAALAATATTAAIATFGVPSLASAADTAPTQAQNTKETCVTKNPDGSLRAPQPGDCAQFGKAGQGRTDAQARNVILVVGDGMGQQEITAARNYLKGAAGRFDGIDALPHVGAYTHHSIDREGKIEYVTDSSASATAWSTGTKTYNGAVGIDIAAKPVQNLMEYAKNAGMRTGNVTTSEVQDATPSSVATHALNRKCYGPEKNSDSCSGEAFDGQWRQNGGLGSISEQLVDLRADITLGGGAAAFNQNVLEPGPGRNPFLKEQSMQWQAGKSVLDNARDAGFQVVTNAEELAAVTEANQAKPVLGLFHEKNMTTRFEPTKATIGGAHLEPTTCAPQDTKGEPKLVDMTTKAIELLDDKASDKGFFLQVESASIDKRNHKADLCGLIGEVEQLDEALVAALDFAKKDGNTLVVVTADHAHSAEIIYDATDTVSATTRVKTADGVGMTVGWGTLPAEQIQNDPEASAQHTGAQLRIAAFGPGAENVIGQTDQTDTFYTIANALRFGDWKRAEKNPYYSVDVTKGKQTTGATKTCYLVEGNRAPAAGDCAQFGLNGQGLDDSKAKNLVFMISDGTGDSEITSARNMWMGANGRFKGVDNLDYTGNITTFALKPENGLPELVTDSAASATAWNTGVKTYNNALGVDVAGNPVPTIAELAKKKGMKVGNVSTAEVQDATPAGFVAHALHRHCYGPEESKNKSNCQGDATKSQYRENGGLGSISEQMVDFRADVTLGGGAKAFDQIVQKGGNWGGTKWQEGKSVLDNAKANGFHVVTTAADLEKITKADAKKPLLGLFAEGNIPRNYAQSIPDLNGAVAPAITCEKNPKYGPEIPPLPTMTAKALDLLQNPKGFVLQVEAASVDKAGHDGDFCGQSGEFKEFDETVQVIQNWVKQTGEPTLLVTTADHAHTSQITSNGKVTAGRTTKVVTVDDQDMTINYATAKTNEDKFAIGGQTHTGAQMRVAATGPGAANFMGQLDQTDVAIAAARAIGIDLSSKDVNLEPQWEVTASQYDVNRGGSSNTRMILIAVGFLALVGVGSAAYVASQRRKTETSDFV